MRLCLSGFIAVYLIWINPVAAEAESLAHIHASQRWDRGRAALAAEVRRDTRAPVSVLTLTEIAERRAVLPRAAWSVRTASDVAVMWRRERWRLVRSFSRQVGPVTRALAVLLAPRPPYAGRRVLVTVAHMPSGVENADRFKINHQSSNWRAAAAGWRTWLAAARHRFRPGAVLVVADWNIDLRRPVWRAELRRAFPGLRLTWRAPPTRPEAPTEAAGLSTGP